MRRFIVLLLFAISASAAPITIRVDATDVPAHLLHARLSIPATPGPLALFYPKWIPGEHGPTGPIVGLSGLRFSANGAAVAWSRDPVEMYEFHVDVPAGASALDVDLDYLIPPPGTNFTAGASASPRLAVLSWNTVLLYPQTASSDALQYEPTLRIPSGWKYATALETRSNASSEIRFETVSLTTLVDSPVQMAVNLKNIDLPNGTGLRHTINVASENAFALETPNDFSTRYSRLVDEATALFGANHYRHYDWLFTLSGQVEHFGLEHHESSDDRTSEDAITDEESRKWVSTLLAHEFVHSWNGKYRRPAGLATSSYEKPMNGELLWVYEGLTTYLGELLPYRSGLLTAEEFRDQVASNAAEMTEHVGRTWRPLLDTAVAAQILYGSGGAGTSWRRSVDFYPEGSLIWLDVDMTIRSLTGGKRSLDDFCRAFYGGTSGHPELRPYTFDDLVAALNTVAPHDWRSFLNQRLTSTSATPPLGGIETAGWRLVYNDQPNLAIQRAEHANKALVLNDSLGFTIKEDGTIRDVIPDSPAARAGIVSGAKLIAVNGRRFSKDALRDAVKASPKATTPLEMIVETGEFYTTARIAYTGGIRYPHLERVSGKPDLLEVLGKPLARTIALKK
ncbi:MAG TPA: PDZ domain-containing protein [Thermoanaerobaculia bacterium]|nr:PDZ domain-containing protein [Thermoanaerobaculia bacterium]